jgi:conjugal transfer pilus assembly protein TraL
MTKIPRYIDDPPSFLFWEIDEVIVISLFVCVGILARILTIMLILGYFVSKILKKVKQTKSEGFFLHVLYWHGFLTLKGCPPSYKRRFIE